MGATGESIRRVTDFGFDPAWSPDGKRLVISSVGVISTPYQRTGTGELWVIDVETSARAKLPVKRDAMQPTWSPTGRRIVFWSVERGRAQRDLWTIRADGTDLAPITNDAAVDWNPVWAPDGNRLSFVSDRGGVASLWRLPIDEASGRARGAPELVSVPASYLNGLSIATDGRIIFAAVDRHSTVQRLDFDTQREAVVAEPSVLLQSPRTIRWVDWSPDGNTLAFSTIGMSDNIYMIRSDGTGYRQLTDDTFRNRGPRFLDGSRVLFYSNGAGTYQAWSVRADGSDLQQLTNTPLGIITPSVSPTGDRIAFTPSLLKWAIATLRAPGAEAIEEMPSPDGVGVTPVAWSPDGARIATFTPAPLASESRRMFVYDLASKRYTELGAGTDPRWPPDGRRLLFTDRNHIMLIDSVTRRTRDVFTMPPASAAPGFGFTVSRDGRRIALVALEEQSDLWMVTAR